MKHFAKLDTDNTVLDVVVVEDENASTESEGILYLQNTSGWSNWKQY